MKSVLIPEAEPAAAPRVPAEVAREGLVIATYRRHFAVRTSDEAPILRCVIRGRDLAPACGDRVRIVGTTEGEAVIEAIAPRGSLFFRSDAQRQKLVAANVSQVVALVAADPPFDDELVHRWVVAAQASGCRFLLAANKCDLPTFAALRKRLASYAALGIPVVELSALADASALLPWMRGQHTVVIGQSGMGKSTLVNALVPGAGARVGEVSLALKSGRHTTSDTQLYVIDADSWIVDSPGMKAFGLAHLSRGEIEAAFVDLGPFFGRCRFRDCRHDREPGCALLDAVQRGEVAAWRLDLMRRLIAESGG